MISDIISLIRIDASSHSMVTTTVIKAVTDLIISIINGNTKTAVRIIATMVVEATRLITIIGSRYLSTRYRCAIKTWSLASIVERKIHER
jgi:Na+-transporting NADH:ubiquinone oxidoreductase subunit NqrD